MNDIQENIIIDVDEQWKTVGTISMVTMDRLFQEENPANAVALYMFYYKTYKWQKNACIYANDAYVRSCLNWGGSKLTDAKNVLKKLGLISIEKRRDEGKVVGWYVKLNYMVNENKTQNEPEHSESVTGSPQHSSARTGSQATNTINNNIDTINNNNNIKKEKNTKKKKRLSIEEVTNYETLFLYWEQNKKGGKYTNEDSRNRMFNKLKTLTNNDYGLARDVILHCIDSKYQGFCNGVELYYKTPQTKTPNKTFNKQYSTNQTSERPKLSSIELSDYDKKELELFYTKLIKYCDEDNKISYQVVKNHPEKQEDIRYNIYQLYLEYQNYFRFCKEVGIEPDPKYPRFFSIAIALCNRMKAKGYTELHPGYFVPTSKTVTEWDDSMKFNWYDTPEDQRMTGGKSMFVLSKDYDKKVAKYKERNQ